MSSDRPSPAKRSLGGTDIQITLIGLGTWKFSEAQSIHRFDRPIHLARAKLVGGCSATNATLAA